MDLVGDYASAGFLGRLGFGTRPAVVVVDVVRAYLEPGSPLADDAGRFTALAASTVNRLADAVDKCQAPRTQKS